MIKVQNLKKNVENFVKKLFSELKLTFRKTSRFTYFPKNNMYVHTSKFYSYISRGYNNAISKFLMGLGLEVAKNRLWTPFKIQLGRQIASTGP